MSRESCEHDFVYQGAVNFFKNKELLVVIESWVCRKCKITKLGKRGPDVLLSTEGLYPSPSPDKEWVVLVCMASDPPYVEAYQAKVGEEIEHKCPEVSEGMRLVLSHDYTLRIFPDGPVLKRHFLLKYDDIVRGYVELGKAPPEVVTIPKRSGGY